MNTALTTIKTRLDAVQLELDRLRALDRHRRHQAGHQSSTDHDHSAHWLNLSVNVNPIYKKP